jgi:hypothetical protein
MLSMSWSTPTGFAGLGADVCADAVDRVVARPERGGAVRPVQGSGVPAARLRGTGLFATGMPVASQLAPATAQFAPITPNGTTLGYPSSRRPPS